MYFIEEWFFLLYVKLNYVCTERKVKSNEIQSNVWKVVRETS